MTTHRVQTLYTQKARLYEFFFVELLQWGKVLEVFFRENDYLQFGMKILDAGCGTGAVSRVLHHLARKQGLAGITFHGFDLTSAMLELFRQWMEREGARGITLRQANVLELENQLPPDWTDYDLIVSSAMFEYLPKEKFGPALSNLGLLLKENGRLLVLITKRTWLTQWLGGKWWGANLYTQGELEAEFQQAGFTTIQFKALPDWWRSSMLAVEAKK